MMARHKRRGGDFSDRCVLLFMLEIPPASLPLLFRTFLHVLVVVAKAETVLNLNAQTELVGLSKYCIPSVYSQVYRTKKQPCKLFAYTTMYRYYLSHKSVQT